MLRKLLLYFSYVEFEVFTAVNIKYRISLLVARQTGTNILPFRSDLLLYFQGKKALHKSHTTNP